MHPTQPILPHLIDVPATQAEYFNLALQSRMAQLWTQEQEAKLVVGTPIVDKGKMRVYVDGAEIYSKGGFKAVRA